MSDDRDLWKVTPIPADEVPARANGGPVLDGGFVSDWGGCEYRIGYYPPAFFGAAPMTADLLAELVPNPFAEEGS